ncbi:M16 family metallopeptidase [Varunaivibrio sulfuroxidans]|uniref:Putative Zn-dependent peptidase n=1 Tax=Varunaivibrio sulfuroxidans TaxID=1773489 RepID=A0A4R3JAQ8_9PROT|nr:pitrilysin family protein [Varunaivibrio sulfuroxidans]TCS62654.1 putative Zn-dependent peptidase [Varunaivibrio sulfuroxidans]WES30680.1 pitrilysin family protein [Varunaivibrio sulfuroxidans]
MTRTIRITTLDNGLRVLSDPMDSVETVSAGIWIEAGSRFEQLPINGVSHFLEHMTFKGTARRSAQAIVQEIEDVGGQINAYTSRENTAYYAKALKEDLGLIVDIIADIVQNARLDAEELERERSVILQEISQSVDTPEDIVFDYFQTAAFPDQPIGWPVLGSSEGVRAMPRKSIRDYMTRYYTPSRMILSAAGKIDHDHLVALAENAFPRASGDVRETVAPPQKSRYQGGEFRQYRDLEQVQIILGFEGVSFDDPDYYAASVFSTLLGGGMSSRLFQEIREKQALVYSIYSFLTAYDDGGAFAIHAGTGEEEAQTLMPLICAEIQKARTFVSAEEIARARAQLKAGILMAMESTSARSEQCARHALIYGRVLDSAEMIAKIDAVDEKAVGRAAERLTSSLPTLTALGPVSKIESFEKICARLT